MNIKWLFLLLVGFVTAFFVSLPSKRTYEGSYKGYHVHVYVTKNLFSPKASIVTLRESFREVAPKLFLAEFKGQRCTHIMLGTPSTCIANPLLSDEPTVKYALTLLQEAQLAIENKEHLVRKKFQLPRWSPFGKTVRFLTATSSWRSFSCPHPCSERVGKGL